MATAVATSLAPQAAAQAVHEAAAKAAPTTKIKTTSVLVILVYWTAHHDSVTQADAKRVVLTESAAWYSAASYGQQTLTGTATPWFKIAKQRCGFSESTLKAAKAAAKRHGYNVAKYQRVVVYEPCSAGGEEGDVAITTPRNGAQLSGDIVISGTLTTVTSDVVSWISILIDGNTEDGDDLPVAAAPGTSSWTVTWSSQYDPPAPT